MWTLIVLAAIVVVLIAVTLFIRRSRTDNAVETPHVLTCSLSDDPTITQQTNEDHEIYDRHYPVVQKVTDLQTAQLIKLITEGSFSIVHIIAKYNESGNLLDRDGSILRPLELFNTIHQSKVMLLYLAGNRDPKADITNYWVNSHEKRFRFFVVATIQRGPNFSLFLDRLVGKLANGNNLIQAWASLRPQDFGGPKPQEDDGMIAVCFGKL
jgi:hypothetical protein